MLARLVGLQVESPNETGRYLALIGPNRLTNMVSAARVPGHWPDDFGLLSIAAHLGYLPEKKYCRSPEPRRITRATLNRFGRDNCFDSES